MRTDIKLICTITYVHQVIVCIHTNLLLIAAEKRFPCHICKASFSTKGSLKVHMRLHTGAKPFKCSHCDLKFRTSGHRKSHITTHLRPQQQKQQTKVIVNHPVESLEQGDEPDVLGAEEATKQQLSVVSGLDDLTPTNILSLPVHSINDNPLDAVQLQIAGE